MPDTCEFPLLPDQVFFGNMQQHQHRVQSIACLVTLRIILWNDLICIKGLFANLHSFPGRGFIRWHQFSHHPSHLVFISLLKFVHQKIMPAATLIFFYLCCYHPAKWYGFTTYLCCGQSLAVQAVSIYLLMKDGSLTRQITMKTCYAMWMADQFCANKSIHSHLLIRSIPNSSAHTIKPNMARNCDAILTCHIWTPKYAIEYMCSSKKYWSVFNNDGLFVPVKNTNVLLALARSQPLPSRNFSKGPRRHPSCRLPLLPLKKVGKYIKLPMDACYSKLFLLLNPIRSTPKTLTNSSGTCASTAFHWTQSPGLLPTQSRVLTQQ